MISLVTTLQLRINESIPYELDNMLYENINKGLQIAFNDKNNNIKQFSKFEMIELFQSKERNQAVKIRVKMAAVYYLQLVGKVLLK